MCFHLNVGGSINPGKSSPQQQALRQKIQHLGDGCLAVCSNKNCLILARALREIRYYQSVAMDDSLMIPKKRFTLLVREISDMITRDNFGSRERGLRWEADALTALQMMTEHVIVMLMEMRSSIFKYSAND